MPGEIRRILLVLLIGILSVSSKSDDGVVTVPSIDIPSDGKGIVPAGDGTPGNTSMVVPPGASAISGALGLLYRLTIHPVIVFLRLFLDPIFSLLRGVLSPVLAIVNYALGAVGLPGLGPLLNELSIGLQGYLGRLLGQVSGFVGTLLGPQDNIQANSRSRRSVTSFLMSPITTPMGYAWSLISMPWRIASTVGRVVTTPLYYGYKALSYPVSGAITVGTWPTRRILRMLGFGGRKEGADGEIGEEVDPINDLMGSLSETAQDALAEAMIKGFQVMKSDVLPAIDSAFVNYQDSDMVPDSVKGYMKNFHRAYSLLHTLRIL
ncbi:uncharacterized protein LOC107036451 [Diachasma alloeum]|uniref:uncharacterized protein LOC107036451 n=1 Tax=Diachasma alloeum TaxID=454923 RepID=UPI000738119D|nr:uncharacterized protein LOC107036451 [Diachasma alloeum]